MVTVRRSKEQLADRPVGDVSTKLNVTPQSLGSGIGQGLTSLGKDLAQIAAIEKREQENAVLTKSANAFQNMRLMLANGDPESGVTGYKDDLLEQAGEKQKTYIDLWDETTSELVAKAPEALREKVTQLRDRQRVSFLSEIQSHTRTQMGRAKAQQEVNAIETNRKLATANYQDKNAVLVGIGEVAGLLINNAGDSEEAREGAKLRAEAEASKTLTAAIGQALESDDLEVAKNYIEDENVKNALRAETYTKLKENLDQRLFVRDTRTEVAQVIEDQRQKEDFSQTTLNTYMREIDEQYDATDPKREQKKSLLEASWRDAKGAIEAQDREVLKVFSDDLARMSRAEATTALYKLPERMQADAKRRMDRHTFAGDADVNPEEQKIKTTVEQNRLKTEYRRAIRSGLIKNQEDLENYGGRFLTNASFKELTKMFGAEAEKKYESQLAGAVEGAVQAIYPDLDKDERDGFTGEMVEAVRIILGGTEPKPDLVRKIITEYQMTQEGKAGRVEVHSIGGRRMLVKSEIDTFESDIEDLNPAVQKIFKEAGLTEIVNSPERFAEQFGNIRRTELSDDELRETEARMRADNLDPEKSDPVAYFNRVVLGFPMVGQTNFGVAERVKAHSFLMNQTEKKLLSIRTEEADTTLRNDMGEYVEPRTNTPGSDGMFMALDLDSSEGKMPAWMTDYLTGLGNIRNINPNTGKKILEGHGNFVPMVDIMLDQIEKASDKKSYILRKGGNIINGVLNGKR